MLIRSFIRLQNVSPGFNTDNVILMQVALTNTKFNKAPLVTQFYDDLAEHVRHMPGVKNFGAISALPLTSAVSWGGVEVEGYVPPPTRPKCRSTNDKFRRAIFQQWMFSLVRVEILPIRIRPTSTCGHRDEKMANHFWPNADPIGKRVRTGGSNAPWLNIVGVTGIENSMVWTWIRGWSCITRINRRPVAECI